LSFYKTRSFFMKKTQGFLLVVVWMFLSAAFGAEPLRTWTNPEGKTVRARMLSHTKSSVTLMTESGATYILPFEKLSREDVEYVKAKQAAATAPDYDGGWVEDFEEAKNIANAERKPILMLFTGSDWCGYCITLEKNVLSQPEFKTYAREHLVLMLVDFPRRSSQKRLVQKANRALLREYGVSGYPTLILVDEKGRNARRVSRGSTPEGFIQNLEQVVDGK